MSRRERISDFTRPVQRIRAVDSNRIVHRQSETTRVLEAAPRSTKVDFDVKRTPPKAPPASPRQDRSRVLRRQGLKKLPEFKPRESKRRLNVRMIGSLTVVALILLVTPVLIYKSVFQNDGFVKGAKRLISGNDLPKYFTAGTIMDVAAKVDVIDNIDDSANKLLSTHLGWYQESGKPSHGKVTVLVGNVSGSENKGAFGDIQSIKEGDAMQLETGDGKILVYEVREIKWYEPHEITEGNVMRPAEEGKEGLNLVTLTDKQDNDSPLAKKRIVVYASVQ